MCLCVCLPVFCAHMAANPRNMAVRQSVLPIATRHLTPRMVDPDSVAGAKLSVVEGNRDGGETGSTKRQQSGPPLNKTSYSGLRF